MSLYIDLLGRRENGFGSLSSSLPLVSISKSRTIPLDDDYAPRIVY